MALTFEQARTKVADKFGPRWKADGTYHVADTGFETVTHFIVVQGAKECLVDGDPQYALLDDTVTLVDKKTGLISQTSALTLYGSGAKIAPVN